MSDNFRDFRSQLPDAGHFLIGTQMNNELPELNLTDVNDIDRLKFWNMFTKIKQNFWNVWLRDYLTKLQNHPKWKHDAVNLKVDDCVGNCSHSKHK